MLCVISAIENEQDRTFVEEIYLKYEKRMYIISHQILKDHHDAEDCIHETVRKIIDCIEKFKSAFKNNALDTLIMITCKNCAINIYNKRAHRRQSECDSVDLSNIPSYDTSIEEQVMNEIDIATVGRLIRKLDPIYQDVITLRIMEFSYEEISKLLGISSEAARKRMYSARQKLMELGENKLNDTYR